MTHVEAKNQDFASIYWPLRLAYGLVPLLAGLDKFVGILTDWEQYLSPTLVNVLPVAPQTFLGLVGGIEIVAGLVVLGGAARLGGYVVAGWLVAISINLVVAGILDVAVRDLVMAVGAYTLSRVAALRGEALVPDFADLALGKYDGETA